MYPHVSVFNLTYLKMFYSVLRIVKYQCCPQCIRICPLSPAYHSFGGIINHSDILGILHKPFSHRYISWPVRFKGFCRCYYCCTTNICLFTTVKRDTLERKSILHLDSPASELAQPLSYHNLYLILTSPAVPPYH